MTPQNNMQLNRERIYGTPCTSGRLKWGMVCRYIVGKYTVFALLCFVVVIHWLIFPYPSGLLHWHCGNLTIASVPAKQPWWIWINTSCEFIMNGCITTTKKSTTKPCAYFLGYTVRIEMPVGENSDIRKVLTTSKSLQALLWKDETIPAWGLTSPKYVSNSNITFISELWYRICEIVIHDILCTWICFWKLVHMAL